MATSYTSLLGLALPVQGELSGTWGDVVNNGITSLVDSAVAGTTTLSTDADVTLTTTTGAANTARAAILLCTGARTVLRNITAPAASKTYTVINATTGGFAVVIRGAGPTAGISVPAGFTAQVAWNGSDFVQTAVPVTRISGLGTGVATALAVNVGTAGSPVVNGGALGTPSSGTVTNLTGTASININGTVGATTPNAGTFTSFNTGQLAGLRNKIINGAMAIAQRSGVNVPIALTTSRTYVTADRWAVTQLTSANGFSAVNTYLSFPPPQDFLQCMRIGRNLGATTTGAIQATQVLETQDSQSLRGKNVTLSFYALAEANFSAASNLISVALYTGTSADQSTATIGSWPGSATPINTTQAITSSWVRYSFTATLSVSAVQIGVLIGYNPTGTAGAADNIAITGVQLEIGSVATPFEQRPYGMELALCQRYYYKIANTSTDRYYSGSVSAVSATRIIASVFTVPCTLRVSPTMTYSGLDVYNSSYSFVGAVTSLSVYAGGTSQTPSLNIFLASGMTTGSQYIATLPATTGYVDFSAEL